MYYYSKKSKRKIIHTENCFYTKNSDVGVFETITEAYDAGYRLCKHCSLLRKSYRGELKEILDFSRKNGMSVFVNNRSINISSIDSKWKIVVDDKNEMVLYHKNEFVTDRDHLSMIDGYHLQGDVKKDSITDYLKYIVDHDHFRLIYPLYIPRVKKEKSPPKKGTKRYKSAQRRIAKYERKQAISNVISLIESLSVSSSPTMAVWCATQN